MIDRVVVQSETLNRSRRRFLGRVFSGAAVGLSLASLPGCSTSTSADGAKTLTIDVDELVSYGTAVLSAGKTVVGIAQLSSLIGATQAAAITSLLTTVQTGLSNFETYAGTSLSLTLSTGSVPDVVTSLLADIQQLATLLSSVASDYAAQLGASLVSEITTAASAISTIAAAFKAAISSVTLTKAQRLALTRPAMTRYQVSYEGVRAARLVRLRR
ncbi:hypothetical protein [Gluconobacter frateurii]|uniref:Uncharacterized protein n=1 Tax=Gluconobacter frateurii NRIC 0228 TaxID=1307946 RepID=A0ABQ0Q929_9PROT|nr:hypothetical protein [Gluconobacter frateurii]GBR09549.1 hypothetical protein AA0228_0714 [Gluconobacter frateurii NRIC 0228]GLP91923.1 hypothetical protein GCM10007868_29980 [Gluconobacter frateurii]